MKISLRQCVILLCGVLFLTSCASNKRKDKDPSFLSKLYHNTTAEYNGYFNANEILKESYATLEDQHQDNYNEILPLYGFLNDKKTESVNKELDRSIEKVTKVAKLHPISDWVDDCYVLMGEAQFLKQDYESAEETFLYFQEQFDPTNPLGRAYAKKKKSKKEVRKEKEEAKKEEKKAKEKERKQKEKEREEARKAKEEERKQIEKEKKAERERRAKEKKRKQKDRKRKKRKRSKKRPKKETKKKTEVKPVVKKEVKEQPKPKKEVKKVEEKEKKQEEETLIANKKDEPKKVDKTAYTKGLMWLAKTYVQRDKYSSAKYLAKKIQSSGTANKEIRRELPVILADAYIHEKDYGAALTQLDEAIDIVKNKSKKARYAFVAGQLSERMNAHSQAETYFGQSKKWARDFKMEFMAELYQEKSKLQSGGKDIKAIIAKLDKMAKEKKYAEYLDLLYFAKGDILLADEDVSGALSSYSAAVKNSSNQSLKVEAYYKMADLYYDREEYVNAKNHYDSTLLVMVNEDPRVGKVQQYSENLSEIASLINEVALQDSLLRLSKLSDSELKTIAKQIVASSGEKGGSVSIVTPQRNTRSTNLISKNLFNKSNFWAYNDQVKNRQADQFVEVWGDIALQDNWRTSSGTEGEAFTDGEEQLDTIADADKELTAAVSMLKSQLPYSISQKIRTEEKIENALFRLGKLYRNRLQNHDKATAAHEDLLKRYPDTGKKLDVYYMLYLANLDVPNQSRAEYYKNKIVTEFADTDYARVLSDPSFAATLENKEKKAEEHYQEAYALYDAGNYQRASDIAQKASVTLKKGHPLLPKFALLSAMTAGNLQGKNACITALRKVVKKYPGTPEKAKADEIMRFLQGDSDAFKSAEMLEVDDVFSREDDKKHYVAVVMIGDQEKLDNAKIRVSNYNKSNHKNKKLQLSDSTLDKDSDTKIILIRKFENKEKAMEYYEDITKAGDAFVPTRVAGDYKVYALTQRNYRKMIIDKSDKRYRAFFQKYYLK